MDDVLLIGAGHIGAMSDLVSDKVNTYAKYFSQLSNLNVCVIEPKEKNASIVSTRYGYKVLPNYDPSILSKFSLVVVASPSQMHFQQLTDCISAKVPNVICEKPICLNIEQLRSLQNTYQDCNSTSIFVNYPRTFLQEFLHLKEFINLRAEKNLIKIQVRYQRGFLNNCSHAFNLVSFILDKKIEVSDFIKIQAIYDHFDSDPTISGVGYWNGALFEISGIPNAKYSLFEIDMYFEKFRVLIDECGRRIRIYETDENMDGIQPIPSIVSSKSIADYSDVSPVLNMLFNSNTIQNLSDNFDRSLSEMDALFNVMES